MPSTPNQNSLYTNFPEGITSFGIVTAGLAGLLPFTGNIFWVDETNGSNGFTGGAGDPFGTLAYALSQCTANQNDVVLFTGTIHVSSTLVWSKNQVHLIGLCNGIERGKRARISVTGATAFTPMISVTASGCLFANFGTFYGFNSASNNAVCWADTGGRNCYNTVEIMGFGDGTASTGTANITAARAFVLSGSTGECTFRNCVFGVDTIVRNATNYTLEISGASPRNYFFNCDFEADLGASGGASSHLLVGASGIDRYAKFVGCRFSGAANSGGTAMAQAFNVNASAGGTIWLDQSTIGTGITAWQTTPNSVVIMNMTAPSAGGGKAIQNA